MCKSADPLGLRVDPDYFPPVLRTFPPSNLILLTLRARGEVYLPPPSLALVLLVLFGLGRLRKISKIRHDARCWSFGGPQCSVYFTIPGKLILCNTCNAKTSSLPFRGSHFSIKNQSTNHDFRNPFLGLCLFFFDTDPINATMGVAAKSHA